MLEEQIDDLHKQLDDQKAEVRAFKQKLHTQSVAENSQKSEINFYNGKVGTLKRDLAHAQQFTENLQKTNTQLSAEIDNMNRVVGLKDKEISLCKREIDGLKEDNDRIHRMYMLMQKEAFPENAKQPLPSSVALRAP